VDQNALSDNHGVIMTADGPEVAKPFVADVMDQETDLIDVSRQHDAGTAFRIDCRDNTAQGVGGDGVGERGNVLPKVSSILSLKA
jgi:hypothetical protein